MYGGLEVYLLMGVYDIVNGVFVLIRNGKHTAVLISIIFITIIITIIISGCFKKEAAETKVENIDADEGVIMGSITIKNVTIERFGHASFMIKGEGKIIYIDPYVLPGKVDYEDQADIILITHEHHDHCSPEAIRAVRKSDSTTLVPENCTLEFRGDARRINEGDILTGDLAIKGINIEVVPAYNIDKSFHPQGTGVGYIIEVDGLRIYHAGDTDLIPQMKDISVDVALLPIGGTYTMDVPEAVEATLVIAPDVVIPMHYNYSDTTPADAGLFKKLVQDKNPDIEVVIL